MTQQELKEVRDKVERCLRHYETHGAYLKGHLIHTYSLSPEEGKSLLDHIDHLSAIIGDRMEEGAFLMQAGAAEERARVRGVIRRKIKSWQEYPEHLRLDFESCIDLALYALENEPRELLPPSEARLEVDRLKAEIEKLRRREMEAATTEPGIIVPEHCTVSLPIGEGVGIVNRNGTPIRVMVWAVPLGDS